MITKVTIRAKGNDALIRLYAKDRAIDEVHVQIEGDEGWIVIGYEDLKAAIKEAEFLFKMQEASEHYDNLPVEIQERMLMCQVAQGNPSNPNIFRCNVRANGEMGGFDWGATKEGFVTWREVFDAGNYMQFYAYNSKQEGK